jgi:hypothetical protein
MNREALIGSWLRYNTEQRAPDEADPDWWAIGALDELVRNDPEIAWRVVVQIVEGSDKGWQLNMIGCGALEDLLRRDAVKYLALLEEEAAGVPKLVTAAASVWLDDDLIRPQLDALLAKYGQSRL